MKAGKPLVLLAAIAALVAGAWLLLAPGAHGPDLHLTGASAAVIEDAPAGTLGAFLTIENHDGPDRLTKATSPAATSVSLDAPVATLAIPAHSTVTLAPDGAYVRLSGVTGAQSDGQLIPVSLTFERAGVQTVQARLAAPKQTGAAPGLGLFGIGDICRVGEGEPAPELSLRTQPDGDGWKVIVVAREFEFTQDLVDGPHIPGTGHGHIYLDGLKLGRLYTPEARIGALPPGRYEVRVTLNTNDHRAYVVGDIPVSASTTLVVD